MPTLNPIYNAVIDGQRTQKNPFRQAWSNFAYSLENVAALRDHDARGQKLIFVGQNLFKYDAADTTTADDGVNCIHDSTGKRYKWLQFASDTTTAVALAAHIAAVDPHTNYGLSFANRADVAATNLSSLATGETIYVRGHTTEGIGGAYYTKLATAPLPVKTWHVQSSDGGWFELSKNQLINPVMMGAAGSGIGNDAAAVNAALEHATETVDGLGLNYRITSSVTIPANKRFQNFIVTHGTSGMTGILVNTGNSLQGKIVGTGTTSIVERGIYPAANQVHDVKLDIEVTNMTFGVHSQPLSGVLADQSLRWSGRVYAHDIVGTPGASEGYGVLLSPASDCTLEVVGREVPRHLIYLSAGAQRNKINVSGSRIGSHAISIYSVASQPETSFNFINADLYDLYEASAIAGSGAATIVENAHDNTLIIRHQGNNATRASILVEGFSASLIGTPKRNKIVNSSISGQFTGNTVIRIQNAQDTYVYGNHFSAYSTNYVILDTYSGTNAGAHGAHIEGNVIDCVGAAINGISVQNAIPSRLGLNEIRNNAGAARITDFTAGARYGHTRMATFSATSGSIAIASAGDVVCSLSRDLATTGRATSVMLTGMSAAYSENGWVGLASHPSPTQITIRAFNGGSSSKTISFSGTVLGD